MGKNIEKSLEKIYYELNSPASYAGILKVYNEARKKHPNVTLNDVSDFLHKQRTYTLFKPLKKRFKRLKTIPWGLNTDWQCDLCIFDSIAKENDGYKYLLVCIDVLSRKIYVSPAKSKKSEHMIEAFEKIFNKSKIIPHKIYSDSGVEFQAEKMLNYFNKREILKNVMYSPDLHAGVVERANRTIKERLYRFFSQKNTLRWIDVIDKIVNAINNSVNRTLNIPPNLVNKENAQNLWKSLYKDTSHDEAKTKYKIGDIVRITKAKGAFDKGYYPNFTDEIFKIANVNRTHPPSYRVEDLEGNIIKGIFYEAELVKTTLDTTYRVAEVLKSRINKGVKEHFVRWVGYSDKYNSWVKDKDLVK
jgi:hypothetical protein